MGVEGPRGFLQVLRNLMRYRSVTPVLIRLLERRRIHLRGSRRRGSRRQGRQEGRWRRRRTRHGSGGLPEGRPGGDPGHRQRGSLLDHFSEGAGGRPVDHRLLPRGRLRQDRRPAVHHRSAAVPSRVGPGHRQPGAESGRAGAGQGQPGARHGAEQIHRGECHPLCRVVPKRRGLQGPVRTVARGRRCLQPGVSRGPGGY